MWPEGRAQQLRERREEALPVGAPAGVNGGKRWRRRKGERRGYGRGREKTRPEEESASVTGGEGASVKGEGEPGGGCSTVGLSNGLCLLFVTGGGMARVMVRCGALL